MYTTKNTLGLGCNQCVHHDHCGHHACGVKKDDRHSVRLQQDHRQWELEQMWAAQHQPPAEPELFQEAAHDGLRRGCRG